MTLLLNEHLNLTAGIICQYCPGGELFLLGCMTGAFAATLVIFALLYWRNKDADTE